MKQFYHLPLRKSIAFGLLLCSTSFYAQISNNNNPHPSAALDINATNKGLLLPRVALTGTADVTTIPAPATSLVVYHTTTVAGMPEGFYYWNGIRWESLSNEAVTHAFASALNTLTSTVNGVQKTAPIINTNALSLTGTNLTSTVNGKASTALNLASIVPATTNVLTSNTNTLTSTVNNVPKTAPIINTNALALTGTNLTSTVNGVTSNALSLATLAGWSLTGNAIGAAANFLGTTDNQPLRFRTNNTEKMTITAAGNVGIGNTAPNAPLQFNTAEASRKVVLYDNKNNDHEFYGFGINASLLRSQINAASASFGWFAGVNATTSNELMRLGGNGALSLGTATGTATMTGARLDVAKGEVRFQDLLSNGAATDNLVTITSSGYLKKRAIGSMAWSLTGNAIGAAANFLGTTDNQPLRFRTNNTEKMTILGNGNLGIATTTPEYALDVRPEATILARFMHKNGSQGMTFGYDNITKVGTNVPTSNNLNITTQTVGGDLNLTAGRYLALKTFTNQPIIFSSNNTERMRLDGNGRLALGTITPTTARLTVTGVPSVAILASFRDGNNKAGFDIDWTALNRIDADNANSNFNINAKGTGAVVLNKAIVSNLPAGAVGEQVVVVDGSNNLKKIAAASVGKTYVVNAATAAAVTSATSGITTTATVRNNLAYWNANQLQGRAVATTAPANEQFLRYNGTAWAPYRLPAASPTLLGTMGGGTPLPNSNNAVYTKAYIDLPARSRYIITVNMLATSWPTRSSGYIWVRSWFTNSSTSSTMTSDVIGGGLISGSVTQGSMFTMVTGTVILNNTTTAMKRYYYWGQTGERSGNTSTLNNFANSADGENQIFAVPITN